MGKNNSNGLGRTVKIRIDGSDCYIVPQDSTTEKTRTSDNSAGRGSCIGELEIEGKYYRVMRASDSGSEDVAELLTSRELQIAHLVAKGMLNKQIANKLSLSTYTISTHLRRIYIKLGVHNRTSLASRLFESTE